MILTKEQVVDTPIPYLQRRFNDTFVIHPHLGLIHVLSVDRKIRYKKITSLFDAFHPQLLQEKLLGIEAFEVAQVSPETLGYFNTPLGAIRVEDKAGRQWTWGFSNSRFNIRTVAAQEISQSLTAWCCFNPQVYPEQFIREEEIAVGHCYVWKKDNHVYDRFGYDIAWIDSKTKQIKEIFLPTFEDEFKEEWSKLWHQQ